MAFMALRRDVLLNPLLQLRRGYRSTVFRGAVAATADHSHAGNQATNELIDLEEKFSAHNYHPLPVVFAKAKGAHVWDPEGRHYLDFLSAYSAVNQGHGHPKIVQALIDQAQRVTLSSRAFHNDQLGRFAKKLTSIFGYEMMLPMNTGAEGVETAIKVARKWGYERKGIPKDQALIVSCCGCFHGRTLGAISMSCDNEARRGFGPDVPGQIKVDFADIEGLRAAFEKDGDKIAAFIFEPIQGEAGVVVPPEGYLQQVRDLCSQHNILMIADEIQTGIARTGRMLAVDWENVRPDMVILGKAIAGGVFPVSVVLADSDILLVIKPGEHGSTFGGNPVGCAVASAALDVVLDEKLAERAATLGEEFRAHLNRVQARFPDQIATVRGKGLLNAVVMNQSGLGKVTAWDVCMGLKERGILAKPTHETIIRLAPPITIDPQNLKDAADALEAVLEHDLKGLERQAKARGPAKAPEPCDRCGRVAGQVETDL